MILLDLFVIVKSLILHRKQMTDPGYKEFVERTQGLVVYSKVHNPAVEKGPMGEQAPEAPKQPIKFRRRLSEE